MPRQAINNVTMVGYVADAPIKSDTENAPLIFTMGVHGSGKNNEETGYWRVVIFGERGDKLQEFLKKGSTIAVSGALRRYTYVIEDMTYREVEIHASDIQFVDTPRPVAEATTTIDDLIQA